VNHSQKQRPTRVQVVLAIVHDLLLGMLSGALFALLCGRQWYVFLSRMFAHNGCSCTAVLKGAQKLSPLARYNFALGYMRTRVVGENLSNDAMDTSNSRARDRASVKKVSSPAN
jgi:hypothetical protein